MRPKLLIAHAQDEDALAEELARPLRGHGYEVVHLGTVLVGDSIIQEASKVLISGGAVILCGTIKALGTGWAHTLINAARHYSGVRVFAVQMQKEAYVQQLALDGKVALYWQDPQKAMRDLIHALNTAYQLQTIPTPPSDLSSERLQQVCADHVATQVGKLGAKYLPHMYVNRVELEHRLHSFITNSKPFRGQTRPNTFLIVDSAGAGKTTLLAHEAERYVPQQLAVLLLGTEQPYGLDEQVRRSVHPEGIAGLARAAQDTNKEALLFIDAINEASDMRVVMVELETLIRDASARHLKFVITCRDLYWRMFAHQDIWELYCYDILKGQLTYFSKPEAALAKERYFVDYHITANLGPDAREALRHPLLLRFFCEVYGDPADITERDLGRIDNIRLIKLFDSYLERKSFVLQSLMPQFDVVNAHLIIRDYLIGVGRTMLRERRRWVNLSELPDYRPERPLSELCARLLSEDILLEMERGLISFRYQEFEEYIIAIGVTGDIALGQKTLGLRVPIGQRLWRFWRPGDYLVREVVVALDKLASSSHKNSTGFESAFGIMLYVGLIMQERGVFIWSYLLKRGHRWHGIVCSAVRRLRGELLTPMILGALRQLTGLGDKAFRYRLVDALGDLSQPDAFALVLELLNAKDTGMALRAMETTLKMARRNNAGQNALMSEMLRTALEGYFAGRRKVSSLEIYCATEAFVALGGSEAEAEDITKRPARGHWSREEGDEISIEAGVYIVGKEGSHANPSRRVILESSVTLDARLVTYSDFEAFVQSFAIDSEARPRDFARQKIVVHVTWYDAALHARWRGKRIPKGFEWEIAARSGQLLYGVGGMAEWSDDAVADDLDSRIIRGSKSITGMEGIDPLTFIDRELARRGSEDCGFRCARNVNPRSL